MVASLLYPSFYLYMNEVVSCFDRSVALAFSGVAQSFDAENRAKGGGSSFCLSMMSLLPPSTHPPFSLFLTVDFLSHLLSVLSKPLAVFCATLLKPAVDNMLSVVLNL